MSAQERVIGPIISDYGVTYAVEDPDLRWDMKDELKIIFDITRMSDDTISVSSQINTLARCMNMHVNTGVPVSKIKLVGIFHSSGTYSILNHLAYHSRYGHDNPNYELLSKLSDVGVELLVCGQSLYSRGVNPDELHPDIKIALSAMTALSYYDKKGYTVIKF